VSIEPIMLRFIPTFTSRMAVISQTGQFQLIEPGGPMTAASMFVYHINTQGHMCSTIDISSNCNVMVFGDTGGNIHLYGDSKVADECIETLHILLFFLVGHCYLTGQNRIMSGWIGKNNNRVLSKIPKLLNYYFLILMYFIPKAYKRVEMKYSRLGESWFEYYVVQVGLPVFMLDQWTGAPCQVSRFAHPVVEFCLACELGFLFYMLDQWTGAPCQASNFLRAFRTIPQASALGLVLNDVDESAGKANFPRLIQSWIRFVLQQTHQVWYIN
ncbi:predicted protein, partial [Nematostella vectensis]